MQNRRFTDALNQRIMELRLDYGWDYEQAFNVAWNQLMSSNPEKIEEILRDHAKYVIKDNRREKPYEKG